MNIFRRLVNWIKDGGLNFFKPATEAPEEWDMVAPKVERPRCDFKGKASESTLESKIYEAYNIPFSFDVNKYLKEKYGMEVDAEWIRENLLGVRWSYSYASLVPTIGAQRTRDRKADYRKVKSQRAKYRRLGASKRARMRGVKK